MIALSDPVTTGLVASLARPGGNITGQAIMDAEIAGKRVELLTEVVSGLRRVLLITYPADPTNPPQVRSFQAAARALRITLVIHEIRTPDDLPAAFATGVNERVGAAFFTSAAIFTDHRRRIIDLAATHKVPLMASGQAIWAQDGALMSYGTPYAQFVRGAATYVDRILKGAKPADLPVTQPTKFELAINTKTAKVLGLRVPHSLLLRADHVID